MMKVVSVDFELMSGAFDRNAIREISVKKTNCSMYAQSAAKIR